MMIDIPRLFGSTFNATASRKPLAWMVAHKLWYRSWHQVPAGSLPNDDDELCHLAELGFDLRSFRQIKPLAMRGWVECDDGRLYHPVVAQAALEAWLEKLAQRLSSGAGNAKRWKIEFDAAPVYAAIKTSTALLAALDPNSKALVKAARRQSQRTSEDDPDGIPDGTPDVIPSGSLETGIGTETGNSKVEDIGTSSLFVAPASPSDPETPSPPTVIAQPISKPDRKPRATKFVPADWSPSPAHVTKAAELGVDLDAQVELFRLHEYKDPKSDFDRAFHTWLRNAAGRFAPPTGRGGNQNRPRGGVGGWSALDQAVEGFAWDGATEETPA